MRDALDLKARLSKTEKCKQTESTPFFTPLRILSHIKSKKEEMKGLMHNVDLKSFVDH